MIFVIDAEDQQYYLESLDRMSSSVARLHEYNPKVIFDIFIHKEGCHTVGTSKSRARASPWLDRSPVCGSLVSVIT